MRNCLSWWHGDSDIDQDPVNSDLTTPAEPWPRRPMIFSSNSCLSGTRGWGKHAFSSGMNNNKNVWSYRYLLFVFADSQRMPSTPPSYPPSALTSKSKPLSLEERKLNFRSGTPRVRRGENHLCVWYLYVIICINIAHQGQSCKPP